MGIGNLLPYVKTACRPVHISELSGYTVGVDISCWLHRGVFGCIQEITDGVDTDFYVHYCRKYVNVLLSHNIRVILVFDGRSLPAKKQVNESRSERKEKMREEAKRLSQEGRQEQAWECLKQTTHITFEMIQKVIEAFSTVANVDCIVSPYESDAQLTYLCNKGMIHAVCTEDSDLIPFGCKRVMFKLDVSGTCTLYERNRLHLVHNHSDSSKFDFQKFRRICILAGCDYLQNGLPGIGLAKATKFFKITNATDMRKVLPKIRYYLNMPKLKVTNDFIDDFIRAEETFSYQIVYDPVKREQVPLHAHPHAKGCQDFPHAGEMLAKDRAHLLATAALHPNTLRPVKNVYSIEKTADKESIWHRKFTNKSTPQKKSGSPKKIAVKRSALQIEQKSPKKTRTVFKKTTPLKLLPVESRNADDILSMYGMPKGSQKNSGHSISHAVSPYFCSGPPVQVQASQDVHKAFKKPRFIEEQKELESLPSDPDVHLPEVCDEIPEKIALDTIVHEDDKTEAKEIKEVHANPLKVDAAIEKSVEKVGAEILEINDNEKNYNSLAQDEISVIASFTHVRKPLAHSKTAKKKFDKKAQKSIKDFFG